jgi:hypothetical protein
MRPSLTAHSSLRKLSSLLERSLETLRENSIAQTHRPRFGGLEADLWTYTRVEKRVWFLRMVPETIPAHSRGGIRFQVSCPTLSDSGTFGKGRNGTTGTCFLVGSQASACGRKVSIAKWSVRKLQAKSQFVLCQPINLLFGP